MSLLKQACGHCGTNLEFDAEQIDSAGYTILCPKCQSPVTLFKPPPVPIPPVIGTRRHRLWIVVAGVGAAALVVTLIVVLANRSNPYDDGYRSGLTFGQISSDEVSGPHLAEVSRLNTNLVFKTSVDRAAWERGFTNGFAEGREQKHSAAIFDAGCQAGGSLRVSGGLKPTDAELDAMSYSACSGYGPGARYIWKRGFEIGWMTQ